MKRNPEKETTIWLPRYVYDEIRRIADENNRSITGELRHRFKIKKPTLITPELLRNKK